MSFFPLLQLAEIVLGTLWRFLNLKSVFATPYNFYVCSALFSQAASVGTLFFFSVYLGKSYISGVIFLMLFFSCFREKLIIRLEAFPLRENFASVHMWLNILLIYMILRKEKILNFQRGFLFLSSFLFFITWQFSVFASLTHIIALFAVDLLGYDIKAELQKILLTFFSSYITALIVSLFPRYLLFTYFPFVLVAIIITNSLYNNKWFNIEGKRRRRTWRHNNGGCNTGAINGEGINGEGINGEGINGEGINGKGINDKGINGKGINSAQANSEQINTVDMNKLLIYKSQGRNRYVGSKCKADKGREGEGMDDNLDQLRRRVSDEVKEQNMPNALKEIYIIQNYKFILMKGITSILLFLLLRVLIFFKEKHDSHVVSLLKVRLNLSVHNFDTMIYSLGSEFNPFSKDMFNMIKESAFLVGSPFILTDIYMIIRRNIFAFSRANAVNYAIYLLCLLACIYPFVKYFPKNEYMNLLHNDPTNLEKNMDLINWLKKNVKEKEALISDIPTSSFLRSTTNFRLILHPQYEDISLRKRVQDYYMLSACLPFSDAKRFYYEKYKVRYYVANIYRCVPSDDSINAFRIADKIDSNYAKCKDKECMRFCERVLYDNTNYKVLYRNGKFSVVYFVPKIIEDNTPYENFDELKYFNIKYFEPWLQRCKINDDKCALHIADVARSYLDILHYFRIGFILYRYVENNLLDNNTEVIFNVGEFYDFDYKKPEQANQFYKKAIDLIIHKEQSNLSGPIRGQVPFVSIPRKIHMISSYIYFLLETALYTGREQIILLYRNLHLLVKTALFALENGYYYEIVEAKWEENMRHKQEQEQEQKQEQPLQVRAHRGMDQTIKRDFYPKELDSILHDLCQNVVYIYENKHEHEEFELLYKNLWKLIKRLSHLTECVFDNFHIFENRPINAFDYFKFFYVYR
ncbi:Dpy-19-like C-mannosyltransferase [Plasmodium brasilianum]|uniref:Dpy-19-like C-mannosyltransferase n=1 Tax=Plasmodium brasilianum TaxID=5824 RepID=A0ACB9YGY0_PLABR|nr:Dpy-19-like C-mannosyltransferase [Plasmodium brasilianum]